MPRGSSRDDRADTQCSDGEKTGLMEMLGLGVLLVDGAGQSGEGRLPHSARPLGREAGKSPPPGGFEMLKMGKR